MARKRIKVSRKMLLTWFILAGLIVLLAPQELTCKFQASFAHIFRWPLTLGRSISLSAASRKNLTNTPEIRQYNNLIANLTEQLALERHKVNILSQLRQRSSLQGVRYVIADILSSSSGNKNELLINRGQKDGLEIGQFILGQNSIIGTIVYVDARTAIVRLITHPQSKIRVTVKNIPKMLQGKANGQAEIKTIPVKQKIKTGEKIFASTTLFLPQPTITAIVSACKRDEENPLLWDITAEPVCDIENLTNVAVIITEQNNN